MDFIKRLLLGGAVLMLAFGVTAGCGKAKDKQPATTAAGNGKNGQDEDYILFHTKDESHHVRLKIDKDNKRAEATMYDSENKEIKPVEADSLTLNVTDADKAQIVLKAQRAESDPKGKSSVFVGEHERLANDVDPAKLEITGKIAEKNYAFVLDTEKHGR